MKNLINRILEYVATLGSRIRELVRHHLARTTTDGNQTMPYADPPTVHGVHPDEYGPSYREHFIEQYKLFVESAVKVTEWRQATNSFFLSICTALITLLGIATSFAGTGLWQKYVAVAGLLLTFAWFGILMTHKQLNASKFDVIHDLEESLPARLFDREWEILGQKRCRGLLTFIEVAVPLAFSFLFLVMFVMSADTPDTSAHLRIKTEFATPLEIQQ